MAQLWSLAWEISYAVDVAIKNSAISKCFWLPGDIKSTVHEWVSTQKITFLFQRVVVYPWNVVYYDSGFISWYFFQSMWGFFASGGRIRRTYVWIKTWLFYKESVLITWEFSKHYEYTVYKELLDWKISWLLSIW